MNFVETDVTKEDMRKWRGYWRDFVNEFLDSGLECAEIVLDGREANRVASSLRPYRPMGVSVKVKNGRAYIFREDA